MSGRKSTSSTCYEYCWVDTLCSAANFVLGSSKVSFDPSLFLPLLRECVPSLDPVALVSIIYHWVRLVAEEGTFSYVLTLCSL